MSEKIALAFLAVVYGFFAWILYLMLRRPSRFFELFVRRQDRWWGIETAIIDEKKFRQRLRLFGCLSVVFVSLHATLVFRAVLTSK